MEKSAFSKSARHNFKLDLKAFNLIEARDPLLKYQTMATNEETKEVELFSGFSSYSHGTSSISESASSSDSHSSSYEEEAEFKRKRSKLLTLKPRKSSSLRNLKGKPLVKLNKRPAQNAEYRRLFSASATSVDDNRSVIIK